MRNIQSISKFITSHTPSHICVRGNKSVHNQIIRTMTEEMREFLTSNKGQELHTDEIRGFFSLVFPKLDVAVNTSTSSNIDGQLIPILDKNDKIKSFIMRLVPIKCLYQNPPDTRIRIDEHNLEIIIHESAHLFQFAIKPEQQIHMLKLKKLAPKDKIDSLEYALSFFFHEYIYSDNNGSYLKPIFSAQINKIFKNFSDNDDRLHLEFLRIFIRQAEMEKQAFELGQYETKMFNSPILKRFKWYQNAVRNKINQEVERKTHFGDKIKTLKKSYFELAKKIHDERLAKSAKNN